MTAIRNAYKILIAAMWLMATVTVMSMATSCVDEDLLDRPDIVPGQGGVSFTVSFFPNVGSNVGSRAAGNSIETINSMQVVLFDLEGNLVKLFNQNELKGLNMNLTHEDRPTMSDEDEKNKGSWTEGTQQRATFHLDGIDNGRYKMYCVANFTLTEEQIRLEEGEKTYRNDEEKFRLIRFTWNEDGAGLNNQMCGYFTDADKMTSDQPLGGLAAPEVTVNGPRTKLHCWLKRMASKVTVNFDPSGLHKDVHIYIHKVTIKDIPRTCAIASDNRPVCDIDNREKQLILDGETIFFDKNGEAAENPGDGVDSHANWMELNDGTGIKGSDHSATANALFFYENNQDDYESLPKNEREAYNKVPKAGWVHEYLNRGEEDKDKRPWDYDTKDNISAGTYIEVEGYYESNNERNLTRGPIIYRFMLGKNTTYNYNAQRNHHYKVTLAFNGWANQPEWHIEYVEEKPALYTPGYFYMPYLYHKRVDMPIRFIGDVQNITVEVVDNDWGPYDLDGVRAGTSVDGLPDWSTDNTGNTFNWNRESWDTYNGIEQNHDYLGFLALTLDKEPPANIIDDQHFSAGTTALGKLKNWYELQQGARAPQNKRTFTAEDLEENSGKGSTEYGSDDSLDQGDHYEMASESDSRTLMLPLFTRAKSMINTSGFSGNNAYEYFYRRARLRVTAVFPDTTITHYVQIYQVPRITNPKGVWFPDDGKPRTFEATLMTRKSSDLNADFTPLKSEGSWSAELETGDISHFSLTPGKDAKDDGTGKLIGKTDTEISFTINFDGAKSCAIVLVKYNAEKCIHRIFLRQGYGPIQITEGGAEWLSMNLEHGGTGTCYTNTTSTDATLVNNPLSFGSYFKRKALSEGILESNNDRSGYGHLETINGWNDANGGVKPLWLSNNTEKSWYQIKGAARSDSTSRGPSYTKDQIEWQKVKLKDDPAEYSLPTYNDFADITKNSEFGYGIFYSDAASKTQKIYEKAIGYAMQYDKNTSEYGMRGIVVYNEKTAKQLFFPLSKSGHGRRTVFLVSFDDRKLCGRLHYGDVTYMLTTARYDKNIFRPIPYNLANDPGAIYWINKIEPNGHKDAEGSHACAAWDMNYFNLDFGPYTANTLYHHGGTGSIARTGSDALPVRLVKSHTTKTGPDYK